MELSEKISRYIEEKSFEIVSRTCDLVKIPSINVRDDSDKPYGRKCAEALDYIHQLAEEKNLCVKNYDYRCLEAALRENQSGKRLVIATHADVVPTEDDNIYEPFAGRVYGNYIIGRGAVDDKGPLIASLYALAFFKEYDIPLKNDIRLFFGSNEECGMDDLEYYIKRAGEPDWGLSVDDDFPCVIGEKSLVHFTMRVPRAKCLQHINSHGSAQRLIHDCIDTVINGVSTQVKRSESVENPVLYTFNNCRQSLFANKKDEEIMLSMMNDTDGKLMGIDREDEITGKTSVKVINVNEDKGDMVFKFDIRFPVSADVDEICSRVKAYGEKNGIPTEIVKVSRGYYQSPEHPMVSLLTDTYNKAANADEKPYVMSACTYARGFKNGCGFGCGNPHEVKPLPKGHGACHGADEAHNINVLLDAVKYLIIAIKAVDDYWS